jgi:hypothetical protein
MHLVVVRVAVVEMKVAQLMVLAVVALLVKETLVVMDKAQLQLPNEQAVVAVAQVVQGLAQ